MDKTHGRDVALFVLPYMAVFTLFTVLPVVASIALSFTNFNMVQAPSFIGFANYIRLFVNDDLFMTAFQNTLFFAMITGPIGYCLCFTFAWLINQLPPKPRSLLTLLFYAPSIAGNTFMIWLLLFSEDAYGYLNGFLLNLGIISEPNLWLTNVTFIKPVAVIVVLWQSLGASFLAFIAGLQNVDRTLYEAGQMDGVRNRWQELYFITLPVMRPQLMFGAVMSITGSFGIGGVLTGLFGSPSTDYAAYTIVHHLEDYGGVRFMMGYASAIATLLFIMMIGTNKLVQKMLRRIGA
jgi:multiple sugar transport system permease protein